MFQASVPRQTWRLRALTCLIPRELSAYLEWNFFTSLLELELVLLPPLPAARQLVLTLSAFQWAQLMSLPKILETEVVKANKLLKPGTGWPSAYLINNSTNLTLVGFWRIQLWILIWSMNIVSQIHYLCTNTCVFIARDLLVSSNSLVPRPHPLTRKRVWWPLNIFLVVSSQQSLFWTSQWNSTMSYMHSN